MFCPSCRDEYREGFTHCAECGAELVEELPPEPAEPRIGPELVQVFEAHGYMQAEMVRGVLEASGIESLLTGDGGAIGQMYPLSAGPLSRIFVLVRLEDAPRAVEVISSAEHGELEQD